MRDSGFVVLLFVFQIITLPHGQSHAVFGWFISLSGVWMPLCKALFMAEDSLYNITNQHLSTLQCKTSVALAGVVNVL